MDIQTFHRTHIEGERDDALTFALQRVRAYRNAPTPEPGPSDSSLRWAPWNGEAAERDVNNSWQPWNGNHDAREALAGANWDVWHPLTQADPRPTS